MNICKQTHIVLSAKKVALLELAEEENALSIDMGMEIYEHRSSVSRAISEMTDDGLLSKREAPKISKYENIWTLTEKSRKLLE